MPIIPRIESIQGPIPVSRPAVPDISMFPDYDNAKLAGQIGAAGATLRDAGLHEMAVHERERRKKKSVGDYLQAENLKSELAIKLQQAQEDAKNSPAKVREGVALNAGESAGGLDEPMVTTAMIPRSESVLPDYMERQKTIVDDITKRAGGDGVMRYLGPSIERVTRESTMRMQRHASDLQDEELGAQTLDGVRARARMIGTTRPPAPTYDGNEIPVLNPDADHSYVTLRGGIVRIIDDAVNVGALKPDRAEKMKLSELAKVDHGRATQTMLQDPAAWLAASNADTNAWNGRLTEEAFGRLNTRAAEITKQATESRNQARLRRQREIEQDWFTRVQDGTPNPLTLAEVNRAVSVTREMDREHGVYWRDLVTNLKAGKWVDDGELKVRMGLQATSLNVRESFLDEVDRATRPGGLSLETALDYKAKAKAIIQHRNDKNLQQGFQAFHAAHTAGSTMLTVNPLSKLDETARTIRANFQGALLENASRNGWESSAEWVKKNLPFYTSQLEERVDAQVEVLSNTLPEKLQVDPKTGDVTPEALRAARQQAFKRHGVDPKKAASLDPAKLPEALFRELETISQLSEYADMKRSMTIKNSKGAK